MMPPTQYATLKAAIEDDPAFDGLIGGDAAVFIAAELNKPAIPEVIVWRTQVPVDEIMNNGFDWTRVDNATVGKARIWEWMTRLGAINPSKANVRAGIDEAWSGAPNLAHRDSIYGHCKRAASRVEGIYATGTGTTASPSVMGFEGPLSDFDVRMAMGW